MLPQNRPGMNYLGLLIGPKGSTQRDIEKRTGARVILHANDPNPEEHKFVDLEGTADAIDRARTEIEGYFTDDEKVRQLREQQKNSMAAFNMTGSFTVNSDMVTKFISIPNQHTGYVIGKGGETIKGINQMFQVHAQVLKEPEGSLRKVELRGTPENVANAERYIFQFLDDKVNGRVTTATNPQLEAYPFKMQVLVPLDKAGAIIGKGGNTIRSLIQNTGCFMQIPSSPADNNPNMRLLILAAMDQATLERGHQECMAIIQNGGYVQEHMAADYIQMRIPEDYIPALINQPDAVRNIQYKTGTKITIPNQPDMNSNPPIRTVTVHGPSSACAYARQEIEVLAGLVQPNQQAYMQQQQGGGMQQQQQQQQQMAMYH
jgi:far upstream element-binding protein